MDSNHDKLNRYREIIKRILTDTARYLPQDEQAPHKTVFDADADSYAIVAVGWDSGKRVHQFIIHLEIINGKVWLQADNTDLVIADDLERAGIPKNDIVLGFHPPHIRPLTEYAAA